jgi:FkbM family methyltransferase
VHVESILNKITYYFLWFLNALFRAGLRYSLGRARRDVLLKKMNYRSPSRLFGERVNLEFLTTLPWGLYLSTVDRSLHVKSIDPSTWHETEVYPWVNLEEGDVAFDVGAHHGWYTLYFSKKVGENGRVVAVEPNPDNIRFVKRNIKLNNLRNVKLLPVALSDQDGETTLFVGEHSGGHTIMSDTKRGNMTVQTRRLDTLLSMFKEVELLKMDIEAAELIVLRASRQIRKVKRYIVEVHRKHHFEPLTQLFEENGFKVRIIAENRLVACARRD